jgi:hypothetical protein
MTTDELIIDPELDRRLRRTLHAVAETVEDASDVAAFAPPTRRRRRRRVLVAAGCGLAGVPLAAFMYGRLTSEYVQELPPPGVIQSGEIDGVRYWLVESFHEDVCGQQMPGVEIVSAARNQVGSEWNTGGIAYGEPDDSSPGCPAVDPTTWLADPTRAEVAWMRLGEEPGDRSESGPWGAMIAVHPTVRSVTVQADGRPEQRVPTTPLPDDPTGARYAVAALPEDTGRVTVSVSAAGDVTVIDEIDLSRLGN